MKPIRIEDESSLVQWLGTRTSSEVRDVFHRAALRSAPNWFSSMDSDWARSNELTALMLFRLILSSGVALSFEGKNETDEPAFAAALEMTENVSVDDYVVSAGHVAGKALPALRISLSVARISATPDGLAQDVYNISSSPEELRALIHDCESLQEGKAIRHLTLWFGGSANEVDWKQTRILWSAPGSPYAFWLRWYEAALKGNSLNPEQERDIALIPDADWEKGAEHVAVIIAQIEERHDLKAQVVALREQLTLIQAEAATAAHRSHNQPPELLDAAPELQRQITIIFDALDEAETELSQTAPAPSRLKRIGQALMDAIIAIAKYCGGIANKAIVAAAVAGGTAVGGLGVAKLLELAAPTQTLGQSILDYASRLIGG